MTFCTCDKLLCRSWMTISWAAILLWATSNSANASFSWILVVNNKAPQSFAMANKDERSSFSILSHCVLKSLRPFCLSFFAYTRSRDSWGLLSNSWAIMAHSLAIASSASRQLLSSLSPWRNEELSSPKTEAPSSPSRPSIGHSLYAWLAFQPPADSEVRRNR